MVKLMVTVYINGPMVNNTMVNGRWALDRVKAFGKEQPTIIFMWVNGLKTELKVMGRIPGLMVRVYA